MNWLNRLDGLLHSVERALIVALLSVMVTMSFAQVVLRQFFGQGLLWGDTFLRHLVLWVGFLGAAMATSEGKNFAWDTLHSFLKGKVKSFVGAAADLTACAIAVALLRASWEYHLGEKGAVLFHMGKITVPAALFTIILPVGFGLIAVHALIRAAREVFTPQETP